MVDRTARFLSKEEAALAREAILTTCAELSGKGQPSDSTLPALCSWARDIIAIEGDKAAPALVHALADAFGLSLTDAARRLTDPQEASAVTPTAEANLLAILGPESLVARYARLVSESESPEVFHAASLLTAVSGALHRRGRIDMGVFQIYPNLYTILVGPSGSRKDTAIDYACDVVQEAYPRLNLLPVEGSPQGMVEELKEQYEIFGVSDGLIVAPELKVALGNQEYQKQLAEWLTDWFKCQASWKRRLRRERVEAQNLYVTLLGGTTMDWLVTMPESALKGGFLPRIWLVEAHGKRHWKWRGRINARDRAALVQELRTKLTTVPETITFSPEADGKLQRWYEYQLPLRAAQAHPAVRAYYERAHVIAIKMAVVLHVLDGDGSSVVSLREAERAIGLIEATEPGTLRILRDVSTTDQGTLIKDLLDTMDMHGGRATKQQIVEHLQMTYALRDIVAGLQTLVYTETLRGTVMSGREGYIRVKL